MNDIVTMHMVRAPGKRWIDPRWMAAWFMLAFIGAQGFGLWHRTVHGARLGAVPVEWSDASAASYQTRLDHVGSQAAAQASTPFDHSDVECRLLDALALVDACSAKTPSHARLVLPVLPPVATEIAPLRVVEFAAFRSRAPPFKVTF